jgi:16S rRNA processing protein RimM
LKSGVTDLIAVGRIVKAFGIKGEVVVRFLTDSPDRFSRLKRVYLARWDDSRGEAVAPVTETRIVNAHVEPRGARVKLEAFNDRDAAERSVGMLLMIDEAERRPLPEGRFYVHDLIGMEVVGEAGEPLGRIADILHLPAHDVYVVRDNDGEWMLPAVSAFVRHVDPDTRRITVSLIEGMRG